MDAIRPLSKLAALFPIRQLFVRNQTVSKHAFIFKIYYFPSGSGLAKDANVLKRKVIRGGSWKDVGYYLQTSARTYEYQDTAKCYLGFRNVMTFLGRSKYDNF